VTVLASIADAAGGEGLFSQGLGLGPGHVRAEAAQPDDCGSAPRNGPPGQGSSRLALQVSGSLLHGPCIAPGAGLRYQDEVSLPPNFTLLQVVPELETGGAEQTTIDVARAVVAAGGRALVASRGGRMEAALAAAGGELVRLPMQSKNPLVMLQTARALRRVIRERGIILE
jgi:hypothetical protein